MKLLLELTPITVFVTYVTSIIIFYGILKSISDSYYELQKKNLGFLFVLFCWGFAFPMFILGVEKTGIPWLFLSAAGIVFVGGACAMREKLTRKVHLIGAYGAVFFGMLSVWVDFGLWYVSLAFVVIAGLMTLFKVKNHIWWEEVLAFLIIYFVVIFGS